MTQQPLTTLAAPRRLRPVDVGFMKALHEKVNIVPLIAKADCLVPCEIRKLKERVSICGSGSGPGLGSKSIRCAEPRASTRQAQGTLPALQLTALPHCRSGKRLTSSGSTCISSLSVTQTRTRTSSSRIGN